MRTHSTSTLRLWYRVTGGEILSHLTSICLVTTIPPLCLRGALLKHTLGQGLALPPSPHAATLALDEALTRADDRLRCCGHLDGLWRHHHNFTAHEPVIFLPHAAHNLTLIHEPTAAAEIVGSHPPIPADKATAWARLQLVDRVCNLGCCRIRRLDARKQRRATKNAVLAIFALKRFLGFFIEGT